MFTEGILLCLSHDEMFELVLKQEDEQAVCWMDPIHQVCLLRIEKHHDAWWFQDNELNLKEQMLVWDQSYRIHYQGEDCLLYAQRQGATQRIFHMYALPQTGQVTIGRKKGDITINSPHISNHHACLFQDDGWTIEDLDSTNGVYVNHKRITSKRLVLGDVVYLMGCTLVMGTHWIGVNSDDERIEVKARLPPHRDEALPPIPEIPSSMMTWILQPYEPYVITSQICKDPPTQSKRERSPLIYTLGPSLTMGIASLSSSLFMVQSVLANGQPISAAAPSLIMAGSMLVGTLVWPLLTQRYERQKEARQEEKRTQCYEAYLHEQRMILQEEMKQLSDSLWSLYINDIPEAIKANQFWRYRLPIDEVIVCLGCGTLSIPHPYQCASQPLQIKEDPLEDQKEAFLRAPCMLQHAPILFHCAQLHIFSVTGTKDQRYAYAMFLLLQHVLLYAPNTSYLVLAIPEEQLFHFPHFLPHQFDEEGFRFLCHDSSSLSSVLYHLRQQVKPTIVLSFAMNVTAFFERMASELPIALFAFHPTSEAYEALSIKDQCVYSSLSTTPMVFSPIKQYEEIITTLCNMHLPTQVKTFPKVLGFLRLFQVHTIAQLQIEKRWSMCDSEYTLQANLGVMEDGEVMKLDLHERAHGPHGIVAGMTGSGKSELLITLILSLAVSYHPHDCAFILIDYKGGGMAKALEQLPHCAGVITNLDGSMIQRSLNSLHAELIKRQTLFAQTMSEQHLPSMNIDVYLKLFHEGKVKEPLPHLVIVADEFAELKQQEPQFMEQLIRIARIGRSLGIHLILATQKPSGVVDDQIWSNARFHICLKVADKADSMDMLKREEGASIKAVGRYYLQVGYDELFMEGQSAYAKGVYDPDAKDTSHVFIHEVGMDGSILRKWQRPQPQEKQASELQVVIEELSQLVKAKSITPCRLWLDVLPEIINEQEAPKGCIAMVDDPARQRQFPLYWKDQITNTLIFTQDLTCAEQMMKTLLVKHLETINRKPQMIAVIDGDQGTFAQLCHVYASLNLDDEEDLYFFMNYMRKEKKRLREEHDKEWLIFIHNVAALLEAYEDAESWLLEMARDHGRSGITIVMSATSLNEVRTRVFQQFENLYVFHLHDEQEAHLLIPGEWTLPKYPLRARWLYHEQSYEIQPITIHREQIVQNTQETMPQLLQHLTWNQLACTTNAKQLLIGQSLETRETIALPKEGHFIVTGKEGKNFFQLLQQLKDHLQAQMSFVEGLESPCMSALCIRYLPMEDLLYSLQHPLVRNCKQAGMLLWCGKGLEEVRYQWNLPANIQVLQRQDMAWISEEVMIIRRIEAIH